MKCFLLFKICGRIRPRSAIRVLINMLPINLTNTAFVLTLYKFCVKFKAFAILENFVPSYATRFEIHALNECKFMQIE